MPLSRPDHADFWLISEALIDQDAQADSGQSVMDILGRMIHPDSVIYAADQRALRVTLLLPGIALNDVTAATLRGLWVDGFLAGMQVQAKKMMKNLMDVAADEETGD